MTGEERDYLIELALKGIASSSLVSQAYFCGKPGDEEVGMVCDHKRDENSPPIPVKADGMHITEWKYKCKKCEGTY